MIPKGILKADLTRQWAIAVARGYQILSHESFFGNVRIRYYRRTYEVTNCLQPAETRDCADIGLSSARQDAGCRIACMRYLWAAFEATTTSYRQPCIRVTCPAPATRNRSRIRNSKSWCDRARHSQCSTSLDFLFATSASLVLLEHHILSVNMLSTRVLPAARNVAKTAEVLRGESIASS